MQHINKLSRKIITDFASYTFEPGEAFAWNPDSKTIRHPTLNSPERIWSLLHEVSHGELNHATFIADIELIRCETAAWQYAADVLAPHYGTVVDQGYIEDHLDTYRQWLHSRSLCPSCHQNGIQHTQNTYNCLNCRCLWRVNDARVCRLQRIRLRGQSRSE